MAMLAAGQTPDTAAIHGHVTDQTHSGIAAVAITVTNAVTGLERKTQSDSGGNFWLAGFPVGRYQIAAERSGFVARRIESLVLEGGTTAEVTLELSVSGMETQVVVTGSAGEVRADQPQLGTRLSAGQIEEMPLPGRKITWLPLLNAANRPAISQGDIFINQYLFTTNGSGRRQAWFEVDGSTGNDSWGRQTIFSSVPQAAIEEMTLLVNAFSAEYGATTGAVVNLVTRSGTNQFHGSVLELWRPAATEAALSGFTTSTATSGNQITSDTLGQSSVALSGPLGGDTQFSVAGEFSRQDRASPVTSPVAPGSFVGHYRGWLGFFRIDHEFNDRNQLFFRSSVDGFHDTNPNGAVGGNNLPTVDRVFRRRTYSEEVGETAVLSPTLINNLRLQFQLAAPITQFDPVINGTQYQVPVSTGGTFTTGTSQSALLLNRQYQFNDVVSNERGRHTLKFGANVIYAHNGGNSKEFGGPIYLGQFLYNPCTQPLAVCESPAYLGNIANVRSYTQSYGNAMYTVDDVLWSAFAQDDFRVRPGLVLNFGLRYERQTFTDFNRGFAPRVGFAWNPRADGKTVIRGGFGIYYSQVVDNAEANYALTGPTGVFNYTAAPGQIGFPASVAAAPLAAFPAGAQPPLRSLYIRPGDRSINQYLPTSTLVGYQHALLNPYSEQWTFGVERRLRRDWLLSADYVGAHTIRVVRPLDVDPPAPFVRSAPGQVRTAQQANCTRPYWIWWYRQNGLVCNPNAPTNPQPPYALIQSDVNDGYVNYQALAINLTHNFSRRASMLASYVWSHTIDNVDPDVPGGNPNDPNFTGSAEKGNAIYDQRHRFVLSGSYAGPWRLTFGGIATLATGLPYNYTTGANNSGDTGGTTDRPVINGVVVARNAGRGFPTYEVAPFVERSLVLRNERVRMVLRAEAFNILNHANFVAYSGTWGNGASPGPGFGQPLTGIAGQLPARSVQFQAQVKF
jgi:hypothetical protein